MCYAITTRAINNITHIIIVSRLGTFKRKKRSTPNHIFCGIINYFFSQISREKFESGLGFKPRTLWLKNKEEEYNATFDETNIFVGKIHRKLIVQNALRFKCIEEENCAAHDK